MKKLFLVGCPRSGTTWLQMILGAHPQIATRRETHLFDGYVAGLYRRWQQEATAPQKDGLRVLLSQAEFDGAVAGFCDAVFRLIAATKPEAAYLLEKTPGHVQHHRTIRRLYPDALFLHLVRDPRAVVASLLAARKEPWGAWAPADVFQAARIWQQCVATGHHELARDPRACLEIRFEDLATDPDALLARICDWLKIERIAYDPARFSICAVKQNRTKGDPADPAWDNRPNFFRHGKIDGWVSELAPAQVRVVEGICAGLLEALGYVPRQVGMVGGARRSSDHPIAGDRAGERRAG